MKARPRTTVMQSWGKVPQSYMDTLKWMRETPLALTMAREFMATTGGRRRNAAGAMFKTLKSIGSGPARVRISERCLDWVFSRLEQQGLLP